MHLDARGRWTRTPAGAPPGERPSMRDQMRDQAAAKSAAAHPPSLQYETERHEAADRAKEGERRAMAEARAAAARAAAAEEEAAVEAARPAAAARAQAEAQAAEAKAAAEAVEAAEAAAAEAAKPGAMMCDLFGAMSAVVAGESAAVADAGRMGHGLGMQLTEWPSIIPTDRTVLEPGMVLTLEPSVETVEGRIMVHEENIAITESGAVYLNTPADRTLGMI